jgi:hypothetical protein
VRQISHTNPPFSPYCIFLFGTREENQIDEAAVKEESEADLDRQA